MLVAFDSPQRKRQRIITAGLKYVCHASHPTNNSLLRETHDSNVLLLEHKNSSTTSTNRLEHVMVIIMACKM